MHKEDKIVLTSIIIMILAIICIIKIAETKTETCMNEQAHADIHVLHREVACTRLVWGR